MDSAVVLLRDLVAIDSVNPSLVPGAHGEHEVALRLARELDAIGLDVEVTEVEPGRPNVVAVLKGRRPGRTLMFCGHTDTVGVSGMDQPFSAEVRNSCLYGRGAQDMKGGLAAMVDAARRIAGGGGLDAGSLVVAAVIDEEHASRGAEALVSRWRADAAVVTEPTGLDVAVAHKGFQWVSIETHGRAAHGSRPLEGRDAILRMGRVLSRLEALSGRLQAGPRHARLGTPSLHASVIHGGHELSSYPDRAYLQFERRTLPRESADVALVEARAIIDQLTAEDPEFVAQARLMFGRDAYEIDRAEPVTDLLQAAAISVGCAPNLVGMTFWTDAAILGQAGIPSVIFGPGGAGLHSTEEYVLVDEVCLCRDALTALARSFTSA
jgi:acetylornithine deacetylase